MADMTFWQWLSTSPVWVQVAVGYVVAVGVLNLFKLVLIPRRPENHDAR